MPRWTPKSLDEAVIRVLPNSDEGPSYLFINKGDDTVCLQIPIKVEYSREEFLKLQRDLRMIVTPRFFESLEQFRTALTALQVSLKSNQDVESMLKNMQKTPYRHIVNVEQGEEDDFLDFIRKEVTRRGICGHVRKNPEEHSCNYIRTTLARITEKNREDARGNALRKGLVPSDPKTRFNRPMKQLSEYFPAYKERILKEIDDSAIKQVMQEVFHTTKAFLFDAITVVPLSDKELDGIKQQIARGKGFHEVGDESLSPNEVPVFRVYTTVEVYFGKPSPSNPTGFFEYVSLLPKEDKTQLIRGTSFHYYQIDLDFPIEDAFNEIKQKTGNVILDISIAKVLQAGVNKIRYSGSKILVAKN